MQLRNVSKRLLLAAVMLLFPLQAVAQEDDERIEVIPEYDPGALFDEGAKEPDWIPSLRLGLGVSHQGVDSTLSTLPFDIQPSQQNANPGCGTPAGLPPLHCPEGIIRTGLGRSFIGPITGGNPIDGPLVAGGFEIMGPSLESLLGKPRPLFVLDYRHNLDKETTTVRDQTRFDNNRLNPDGTLVDPSPNTRRMRAIGNVNQEFWLLAGLGAAFQLPIEGYNVKLKPSLNYFYSRTTLEAILIQPVQQPSGIFENNFTQTTIEEAANHGLAPRIELDAEIYRQGPLSLGFFLAVDFLVIVGGPLDHKLAVNGCFGDAGTTPFCARVNDPADPKYRTSGTLNYEVQRDRLTYQGMAGIRVSWMGGP